MAELADAADSKSAEVHPSWGFDPPSRHHLNVRSNVEVFRKQAIEVFAEEIPLSVNIIGVAFPAIGETSLFQHRAIRVARLEVPKRRRPFAYLSTV